MTPAAAHEQMPAFGSVQRCEALASRPRVKSWSRRIVGDLGVAFSAAVAVAGAALGLRIGVEPALADTGALLTAGGVITLLFGLIVSRAGGRSAVQAGSMAASAAAGFLFAILLRGGQGADAATLLACVAGAALGAAAAALGLTRLLEQERIAARLRSNVAVYGVSPDAERLCRSLASSSQHSFAGLFEDRRAGDRVALFGVPVSGDVAGLIELVRQGLVDEVILAIPRSAVVRTKEIAAKLRHYPVDVRICVEVDVESDSAVAEREHGLSAIGSTRLVAVHAAPIRDWGTLLKAAEDRIIGSIALVCALPLFLVIGLAIKLDSAGPVFFRQRRHGLCGRDITVWKFRTMRVMENGPVVQQATKDDARITRVGRILRKTSLDELPQLVNVCLGTMSLVGPRPHAIAHNELYRELIASYDGRNQVRPGITGWAQINGLRGETVATEQMASRVDHDLWYIRNWSFLLDLKILLLTPVYGLVHKNAY